MSRPSYDSRAAANRAEFPALAALVDEIRQRFPQARLVAGIEGGREVGKVDDELRELAAVAQEPPPTDTAPERRVGR